MPSLRRTFSSPAVRSSPYPSASEHAGPSNRAHGGGRRRSSGSETIGRRVLADIEWWRVVDGQRDLDAEQESEDASRDQEPDQLPGSVRITTGDPLTGAEPPRYTEVERSYVPSSWSPFLGSPEVKLFFCFSLSTVLIAYVRCLLFSPTWRPCLSRQRHLVAAVTGRSRRRRPWSLRPSCLKHPWRDCVWTLNISISAPTMLICLRTRWQGVRAMLAFPHILPFAPIHLRTSFPSIVTLLVNTPTLQFPRCLPTHLISSTSPEGSRGPAIKPLSILQKSPIYSLQSRESPSSLLLLASPSCRTFLSPHCTAFFSLHTSLASLHDTTFTILEAIHN